MIRFINETFDVIYVHPNRVEKLVPSTRPDICACYILLDGYATKSHTPIEELNQQMNDWFQSEDYRHRALGGGDYAQRRVDQLEGAIRYILGGARGLDDDFAKWVHAKLDNVLNNPPFSEGGNHD